MVQGEEERAQKQEATKQKAPKEEMTDKNNHTRGHMVRFEKYRERLTEKDWYWCPDTKEWFYDENQGPWIKYTAGHGRLWFWHSTTENWFIVPVKYGPAEGNNFDDATEQGDNEQ